MLHLDSTIFTLMGYGSGMETDPLFERYYGLTLRAQRIDIFRSHGALDKLVAEIYALLETPAGRHPSQSTYPRF